MLHVCICHTCHVGFTTLQSHEYKRKNMSSYLISTPSSTQVLSLPGNIHYEEFLAVIKLTLRIGLKQNTPSVVEISTLRPY